MSCRPVVGSVFVKGDNPITVVQWSNNYHWITPLVQYQIQIKWLLFYDSTSIDPRGVHRCEQTGIGDNRWLATAIIVQTEATVRTAGYLVEAAHEGLNRLKQKYTEPGRQKKQHGICRYNWGTKKCPHRDTEQQPSKAPDMCRLQWTWHLSSCPASRCSNHSCLESPIKVFLTEYEIFGCIPAGAGAFMVEGHPSTLRWLSNSKHWSSTCNFIRPDLDYSVSSFSLSCLFVDRKSVMMSTGT
jgi:hypothetical protein